MVTPNEADGWHLYAATGVLIAALLASALYVARRKPRPQYPAADARYREVMAELNASFSSVGQKF
jgi:hypothetical protein